MSRSLVVLPDDSAQPILDAINGATKSLRVKMFVFSDPALLKAVIEAQHRGVKVRVMLNPARRSGEAENEESRKTLSKAGSRSLTVIQRLTSHMKNRWWWMTGRRS
jgi:phosphatidylserine/phosphatidylglycerophosphate/cardiolipin synthase-like enzyme